MQKKSIHQCISFYIFPQHDQFYPEGLSVFAPVRHLRIWVILDTVSTKIQGLSSTPTVIFKDFQRQHHVIACLYATMTILIVPSFTHGAPIKADKAVIGEVTVPQTWREHLTENGS